MPNFSNVAAEFGLLSGLCQYPEAYFLLAEHLSVDDFTQRGYKSIFIVIQSILLSSSNQKVALDKGKLLAKASELNIKNFYEECGDGEVLDACFARKCLKEDVVAAFQQIKKETIRRAYVALNKDIAKYLDETNDTANIIISNVEEKLIAISNKLNGVTSNQIIELSKKAVDIIAELAERPGELGVDIGLPIWQRAIGGIRNGAVTFIAATSKAGKSQLGIRAAINAALKNKIPILICDTELNETTQSVRAFGQFTQINYEILETGFWKSKKEDIIKAGYDAGFANMCMLAAKNIQSTDVIESFKKLPLYYLSVNGVTVQEAVPFLRRWVMQHVGIDQESKVPRCLIIWDYIKLMRVEEVKEKGVGAHDILGAATAGLHDFAEHYNLPIIAFGQTNREIDEDIGCIAGAKKIVELTDSSSLFKLKKESDLSLDPTGTHLMKVFLSRFGRGINGHVNLKVDLGIGAFQELGIGKNTLKANKDDGNSDGE